MVNEGSFQCIGKIAEIAQAHGMDSTYSAMPNSYCNVTYSLFNLRVGLNYKKFKNRACSKMLEPFWRKNFDPELNIIEIEARCK